MLNKKEFLSLVLITAVISVFSTIYRQCNGIIDPQKKAQESLHERITSLSIGNISSIEIRFVKMNKLIDQKCSLTDVDTQSFLAFMNNVDFMQVGGHNRRIYEGIIVVNYKNETQDHFIGTVFSDYEFNKGALYIYNDFFRVKDGFYLANGSGRPVRVLGLGQWIATKCPTGIIE